MVQCRAEERCAGRLVEVDVSGELQLLGHPWRFLWLKIQFCFPKGRRWCFGVVLSLETSSWRSPFRLGWPRSVSWLFMSVTLIMLMARTFFWAPVSLA
jgi:hypothetical protein